ncbi:SLBB domain-containing protein [Microcoleus sp. FACHB-672]|uniref:SLBB domain-containing protein n=1 Tax=Microcoleus sp. FACHB-672 TaxID=2692825 RepID=UPI00168484B9|nr:SLBB domain-containing protein [Microcoleus sp. FACHB-672]MBD2042064.1 SLBB domain-containing protein [Microcoleus sp. FACHB-672]
MKKRMLCMVCASSTRPITQLVAGLSLVAMSVAVSNPAKAQLPPLTPPPAGYPAQPGQGFPPPQLPSSGTVQSTAAYTLGGGDNIRIDIFELPQYSGEYQIPAGGAIQLPLIGSVSVEGLTLEEASDAISQAYARVLKRPLITLSLLATRPLNILISGEVNRPGSYPLALTSGAGTRPSVQFPTLLQAIERAQGVTLTADIQRIQLRRSTARGPAQVLTVNLREFLETGRLPQDLTLRDGDSIFVPTATQVAANDVRQLSTASFGTPIDQPRTVAVLGEVNRPGSYVVVGGNTETELRTVGLPSVTRAIQLAGGIRPMADVRRIQVRRLTKAGGEQLFNVNLWQLLQQGDLSQDAILQDGDTVIIPTATELRPAEVSELATASFSPDNILVSVVGEVGRPGFVEVPPNTTLNQALLSAGGFNNSRAYRESVELIRLNFDGTVSRRTVPVDFAQGINEQTNPLLRPNDIIVVKRSGIASVADTVNTALSPAGNILALVSIPNRFLEFLTLLGIIK